MIQIIDNVISKTYQDNLEKILFGKGICWTFYENLTKKNTGEMGFGHCLSMSDENYQSEIFNVTLPLIYEISEKTGINVHSVIIGRMFLQLPSNSSRNHDIFHVDLSMDHTVFLYYVNNSDGDTLISEKRYDPFIGQHLEKSHKPKIIERVSPKKGRVVVFDGSYYHAAGVPKQNKRCVLNFDIA